MIIKMLGAAAVFSSLTLGMGTASAAPSPSEPGPNPFANLTCDCSAPGSTPAPAGDLQRGLSSGLANHWAGSSRGETSR